MDNAEYGWLTGVDDTLSAVFEVVKDGTDDVMPCQNNLCDYYEWEPTEDCMCCHCDDAANCPLIANIKQRLEGEG